MDTYVYKDAKLLQTTPNGETIEFEAENISLTFEFNTNTCYLEANGVTVTNDEDFDGKFTMSAQIYCTPWYFLKLKFRFWWSDFKRRLSSAIRAIFPT
jgi:hypothetical protein